MRGSLFIFANLCLFVVILWVGGPTDKIVLETKPIHLSVLNPWRDLVQNSLLTLVYKHSGWVHCCCYRHYLAEAACAASRALAVPFHPDYSR